MASSPPQRFDQIPSAQAPFVGRERELRALQAALESAVAGRGQVVLISGEPGIGKTRTSDVFAAEAEASGALVLWGRCHEWEGAPPYWPWIQILRDYLDSVDDETLRRQLGECASDIAQVLPELHRRIPGLQPAVEMEPEQARFRLFDALTTFLTEVSRDRPLFIILDDIHWADTPSLLLLQFLAQRMRHSRLLVIGTYREFEAQEHKPLVHILGEIVRERHAQRMTLPGLSREDVVQFISTISADAPADALVAAVYDETGGNPFFVGEIVRLLLAEGRQVGQAAAPQRHVPESVREVIRRRLDRLRPECNRILSVAAVAGRSFSIPLLERSTGMEIADLLDLLNVAVRARLIDEVDGSDEYRFSHALIQDTLYTGLNSAQRLRLHHTIGAAMEHIHRMDLMPWHAQLAYHFSLSANLEASEKAVRYAVGAAESANRQFAWEAAVIQYQLALRSLRQIDVRDERQECELLLALGEAQNRAGTGAGQIIGAGNSPETVSTLMEAARIARGSGLVEHFARAAFGIVGLSLSVAQGFGEASDLMREALEALPPSDSILRANLLAGYSAHRAALMAIDKAPMDLVEYQEVRSLADSAVAMARRIGNSSVLSYTLHARAHVTFGPDSLDLTWADADEAFETALAAGDERLQVLALFDMYQVALFRGDIAVARSVTDQIERLAAPLKIRYFDYITSICLGGQAFRDGRFADTDRHIDAALFSWPGGGIATWQRLALYHEQDRVAEVADAVHWIFEQSPGALMWRAMWIRALIETGREDEAQTLFDAIPDERLFLVTPHWLLRLSSLYAEFCATFDDTRRADIIYQFLTPYADHNIFASNSDHVCGAASYSLGILASTLEEWDTANLHFADALGANECWRIRPAEAWTRYSWGKSLLSQPEGHNHERASDLLQSARSMAAEMGMVKLSRYAAVALAQASDDSRTGSAVPRLSPREMDVLRLIMSGHTDKEIAETLFISPRTVTTHVTHILNKLGANTRTEAAMIAVQNRIL